MKRDLLRRLGAVRVWGRAVSHEAALQQTDCISVSLYVSESGNSSCGFR